MSEALHLRVGRRSFAARGRPDRAAAHAAPVFHSEPHMTSIFLRLALSMACLFAATATSAGDKVAPQGHAGEPVYRTQTTVGARHAGHPAPGHDFFRDRGRNLWPRDRDFFRDRGRNLWPGDGHRHHHRHHGHGHVHVGHGGHHLHGHHRHHMQRPHHWRAHTQQTVRVQAQQTVTRSHGSVNSQVRTDVRIVAHQSRSRGR
jgi:hypothetical protein